MLAHDGSGKGAALVAAVAQRMNNRILFGEQKSNLENNNRMEQESTPLMSPNQSVDGLQQMEQGTPAMTPSQSSTQLDTGIRDGTAITITETINRLNNNVGDQVFSVTNQNTRLSQEESHNIVFTVGSPPGKSSDKEASFPCEPDLPGVIASYSGGPQNSQRMGSRKDSDRQMDQS